MKDLVVDEKKTIAFMDKELSKLNLYCDFLMDVSIKVSPKKQTTVFSSIADYVDCEKKLFKKINTKGLSNVFNSYELNYLDKYKESWIRYSFFLKIILTLPLKEQEILNWIYIEKKNYRQVISRYKHMHKSTYFRRRNRALLSLAKNLGVEYYKE